MVRACPGFQDRNKRWAVPVLLLVVVLWGASPDAHAAGASLKVSPTTGSFQVGSTIDVSFLVDTAGEAINAVQADVLFPPDKLQVINPVASTSFISLWVTTPSYSNTDGTLHFQGGLPNPGIKTSGGVISTVTFRVKSAGKATVRLAPTSRVLRNDGEGTNILTSTGTAEFTLTVPPPEGPVVTSSSHPDANIWYNNRHVQLQWEPVAGATGYSHSFDQLSKSLPDETIDTTDSAVTVEASADGVWYFHIRSHRATWGGTTNYPVQIDVTPPAGFTPKFDRSPVTVEDVPILTFLTTDAASGIDHYEVKQVTTAAGGSDVNTLFVEATSPYTLSVLPSGKYRFIVRAFDRAGNAMDGTTELQVFAAGLPFLARVPLLRNPTTANVTLVGLGALILGLLAILALRRFRLRSTFRHDLFALEHDAKHKAEVLERELEELRSAQQFVANDLAAAPHSFPAKTPPAPATPPSKPPTPPPPKTIPPTP